MTAANENAHAKSLRADAAFLEGYGFGAMARRMLDAAVELDRLTKPSAGDMAHRDSAQEEC